MTTATPKLIFEPKVPEGYYWALPVGGDVPNPIFRTGGIRCAEVWDPPEFELIKDDGTDNGILRPADMPWCSSGALVVGSRARRVLAPVLGDDVEFLPLLCYEQQLWLVNVLTVADVLDEDRSDVLRVPRTGRIVRINRPVFRNASLPDVSCFKVSSLLTPVYVSGEVVRAAEGENLTGVRWREVWSLESAVGHVL